MPSSEPQVVVTIVGSPTPSVILPRGQSRTVVLTPRVQRLIDRGFVTVTERSEIAPPKRKAPRPKLAPPPVVEPTVTVVEDESA